MFEDSAPQRATYRVNTKISLVEEHARLNAELDALIKAEAAQPARVRRITDRDETSAAVLAKTAEVEAVEQAMDDSWVDYTLEQRPLPAWWSFKATAPALETVAEDAYFGVNLGKVIEVFLPTCIISPDLTDDEWQRALAGGIWPADLTQMAAIVVGFYIRKFDVPKSRLVLAVRQSFDEQQEQLAASASPSAASKGGSRKSATTTSRLTGS